MAPCGFRRPRHLAVGLLIFPFALVWPGAVSGQEHKTKVPGLDKITTGPSRLAFSGKVQSLDLDRNILNVNTVQGGNTEIFPIKKNVRVATVQGEKLRLTFLTPGTNVIIYYEQKGDRRSVKDIVVISTGAPTEKKSPPSS